MIWRNPWAWLGLVALVGPLLIHLFARRAARVLPFPALRFLDATRLRPARRTRISDPLLLVLRMAILAAAVAALAQPYIPTVEQNRAASTLVRAIIVDSSASMLRDTAVFARAREAARSSADEAPTGRVIVSSEPARMIAGAAAWLTTRAGTRELVIVSDFQHGEITAADIAHIPADIGVLFVRVPLVAGNPLLSPVKASADRTRATVQLLAGPSEAPLTDATLQAAFTTSPSVAADTTQPVAIIFPNHTRRAQLLRDAQKLDQAWQGDLLLHIADDTTITGIARAVIDGRNTLLLFTEAAPGTLAAAQLVAAVLHAKAQQPPPDEQEHEALGDDVLEAWQRAPAAGSNTPADAAQGRWFWLLALLLLGLEGWLRRTKQPGVEVQHERAA